MNYEIIDYISKQLIHNHIKFNATIVSNGTILNKKIIQTIDSCKIRNMQISLDGKRETHNTKRFFSNKQGTYDLILNNVTTLLNETKIQILPYQFFLFSAKLFALAKRLHPRLSSIFLLFPKEKRAPTDAFLFWSRW